MKPVYFFLLISFAVSCKQNEYTGSEVFFSETESGAPEQKTRMLVTSKFLRIDTGESKNDFLLYDRTTRQIFSTNSLDKRTLVISAQPVRGKSPIKLENTQVRLPTEAPSIAGKKVAHIQLSTNKSLCYDLYTVEGLLPDVVSALREYRNALAGEQSVALGSIPKEMQNACDIANNIFYASRHLEYGFPVRLQETGGKLRELVEYRQEIKLAKELFRLPEGYTKFSPEDMRNR